jgi:hypothetical protein
MTVAPDVIGKTSAKESCPDPDGEVVASSVTGALPGRRSWSGPASVSWRRRSWVMAMQVVGDRAKTVVDLGFGRSVVIQRPG